MRMSGRSNEALDQLMHGEVLNKNSKWNWQNCQVFGCQHIPCRSQDTFYTSTSWINLNNVVMYTVHFKTPALGHHDPQHGGSLSLSQDDEDLRIRFPNGMAVHVYGRTGSLKAIRGATTMHGILIVGRSLGSESFTFRYIMNETGDLVNGCWYAGIRICLKHVL